MTDLKIMQISSFINEVMKEATGVNNTVTVRNESDLVSVGTTLLKTGYDTTLNAISQVLSRTIFSERAYTAKNIFGLRKTSEVYGNHVRKIQAESSIFQDNDAYKLVDGESIDMYKVKKPKVFQTNFYGQTTLTYQVPSIFKNQLDIAFKNFEEFQGFLTMIMTVSMSDMEQKRELEERHTGLNLIAGTYIRGKDTQVVHLLKDYNAETGKTLTADNYRSEENFPHFARWTSAKLKYYSDRLTDRTLLFHCKFENKDDTTEKVLLKHTPKENQNMIINSNIKNQIGSMVLTDAFNPQFIDNLKTVKSVNYWQNASPGNEMKINVVPDVVNEKGEPVENVATTYKAKLDKLVKETIIGVLFDDEAAGIASVSNTVATTQLNARGLYYNMFYHENLKTWNDFTENAIVFCL